MSTGSSPVSPTKCDKYRYQDTTMQLKIYINDKLYKTVPLSTPKYEPGQYWSQIFADREAGLLNSFNVADTMSVRYEVV